MPPAVRRWAAARFSFPDGSTEVPVNQPVNLIGRVFEVGIQFHGRLLVDLHLLSVLHQVTVDFGRIPEVGREVRVPGRNGERGVGGDHVLRVEELEELVVVLAVRMAPDVEFLEDPGPGRLQPASVRYRCP